MSIKISQLQSFSLAGSGVSISDTTITLSTFQTIDGVDLAMSDFGSKGYMTIEPGSKDREEQISFTGVTQNSSGTATLTGVKTVLFLSPYTETTGFSKSHPGGVTAVVTNTSGFYNEFGIKENDEVLTGYWEAPDPLTTQGVATKNYVDNLVNGGTVTTNALIEVGTAGETVSAGQVLYLKAADGRWWKADAATAATVTDVQLGIAQGSGTAGNTITGGVLVKGIDSNQSGIVAGSLYYVRNGGGLPSSSAGTITRVIGNGGVSATKLVFDPDFYNLVTQKQKDAMAGGGDIGTPSTSNKFVTQEFATEGRKSLTAGETINGATLPVPVYQDQTDNQIYACDANDTTKLRFIGFAITNGTDNNAITVQFNGVVSGFTALDEGVKYYVQDAVGTIGTTPGATEVYVGIAISTTELLIQKAGRFMNGTFSLTQSTTNVDLTVGFRVSRLKVTALAASNAGMSWTTGSWIPAGTSSISLHYNEASSFLQDTSFVLVNPAGGDTMTFTITNITDTGFRITYTETGTWPASTGVVLWEAEGIL